MIRRDTVDPETSGMSKSRRSAVYNSPSSPAFWEFPIFISQHTASHDHHTSTPQNKTLQHSTPLNPKTNIESVHTKMSQQCDRAISSSPSSSSFYPTQQPSFPPDLQRYLPRPEECDDCGSQNFLRDGTCADCNGGGLRPRRPIHPDDQNHQNHQDHEHHR